MNDANRPVVTIAGKRVGAGESVYVIAEAGVNHNGELRTALAMVDAAMRVGADAIKFQAFRAAALATLDADAARYQRERVGANRQIDVLERLELSPTDFGAILKRCDAVGVEFLATPFGLDDLSMLVDLGVQAIKIASPDVANPLLLGAAARTGLPMLVSTGAAEPDEIDDAVAWIAQHGARDRLVLLHCVSSYPAREADVNLRRIGSLAARYDRPVGYSDHTTSIATGALAAAAGAVVVEKHFTLDRQQEGPDHAFSLEPDQLCEYVAAIRRAEILLGNPQLGVLDAERDVRRVARSSVVTRTAIGRGEILKRANLTLKRPGTGIPARDLDRVVGRQALIDIPPDTLLRWEMIQ